MTPEVIPPGTRPRLSSRARVQMDKITGKPVLLYPEGALILNPTGHAILSLCDGQSTLGQITAELATRYGVATQEISVQVTDYLSRLHARNLLQFVDEPEISP